jgi:hypothetical protein
MLRAYGSPILDVLANMEQCGWLCRREDKSHAQRAFTTVRKTLSLVVSLFLLSYGQLV